MHEATFKGYWMITNRCNLDCGYCVLEDAPDQIARELDLDGKRALVSHLYERLGFRRLTLSGGELTIIGKRPPGDLIALLRHIRQYRSAAPEENLAIEVYTNGALLTDAVADEMAGVVDLVAVTIDSADESRLARVGRNLGQRRDYLERTAQVCRRLSERRIELKLHTVVGRLTHASIGAEAPRILDRVEAAGGRVSAWKLYQYMSYDAPERDGAHAIDATTWARTVAEVEAALAGRGVPLHFKDNAEMNASLFNILSYGNAQYMRPGDSWSTTGRTRDLRTYGSMTELFAAHDIDEATFRRFHEIRP